LCGFRRLGKRIGRKFSAEKWGLPSQSFGVTMTGSGREARARRECAMNFFAENGWLGWIIIGGIAGAVGKFLMPGKDPGGIVVTILLGIAGAFLMGMLGGITGWYQAGDGPDFIAAVLGSIVLLGVYRLIKKNQGGGTA
jgi:uncharacterized membrane protein YeaQ/YmgE (transglycosylase-associated protein family)